MVENFLLGAGAKTINNIVVSWMENSRQERMQNALTDEKVIKAHMKLQELMQKNTIANASRAIIFIMLTAAWCWMGIAGLTGVENVDSTALVPSRPGFLSYLFGTTEMKPVDIKGSTLLYQWYQIMEMMMGAFVMKRK